MEIALYVAKVIDNDLTLCHAKSWRWWMAITQCDLKDGMVYLDNGSQGENGEKWEAISRVSNMTVWCVTANCSGYWATILVFSLCTTGYGVYRVPVR